MQNNDLLDDIPIDLGHEPEFVPDKDFLTENEPPPRSSERKENHNFSSEQER